MTVPRLSDTALSNLSVITAEFSPIKPLAGPTWNVGELALVCAVITNTTGLPLRDAVVDTAIFGLGAEYQGFGGWDGNGGYVGDLEPGDKWTGYVALLKGISAKEFTLFLRVAAEVVPYSSYWPVWTRYEVHPAT